MEIIVPAAGLSTRFPDMPPKYLLRDKLGFYMFENATAYYENNGDLYFGILEEHDIEYDASKRILHAFLGQRSPNVVVLPERTKGPADTVYQILKVIDNDHDDGAFLIKDCDSFFDHTIMRGNYICVSSVHDHETIRRLGSKSFVRINDQGIVTDIVEKNVVSDLFCVGGYKFEKRSEYMAAYEAIRDSTDEIFVSHVIQYMISQGKQFFTLPVSNYIDVGTIDEWNEYLGNRG